MKINDLTVGEVKQLTALLGGCGAGEPKTLGLRVGEQVFIRGAIYHHTGRVAEISGGAVRLEQAAWIAHSGRLHDALRDGFPDAAEIEPEPLGVTIPVDAIGDWLPWPHDLPTKQQ